MSHGVSVITKQFERLETRIRRLEKYIASLPCKACKGFGGRVYSRSAKQAWSDCFVCDGTGKATVPKARDLDALEEP